MYKYTAPSGHEETVTDEQYAVMKTKPAFRNGKFQKLKEPKKADPIQVNKPDAAAQATTPPAGK